MMSRRHALLGLCAASWLARAATLRPLDPQRAAAASRARSEAASVALAPATLRPLRQDDAPLINARWEFSRAERSLGTVRRRIAHGVGALGVEEGGELRASVLRTDWGRIGMLHVDEAYRRRGFGASLVKEATRSLQDRGEDCTAFIHRGNEASERLFAAQGWVLARPSSAKRPSGSRGRAKREWVLRAADNIKDA